MKKRYVIIGLLAASFASRGQQLDSSSYAKRKLSRTDVQILFSYYTQDNNHSAVTGGIGTEDLQVYTSSLSLDWVKDSVRTIHFDAGVDVITSASTDNIDFVVSSASRTDARSHFRLGYNKFLKNNFNAGINAGYSIESDYTSRNVGVTVGHMSKDRLREWSLGFQAFFDDLRWGRFDSGKPEKLIYPEELRYKEWFDEHKRNSFNLTFDFYQVINRRMTLGIFSGLSYQHGLLATPFHRVYFTDESERVEDLPENRFKTPVGLQLNTFVGSRWILRTYYRFYWDDFGITAHTASFEAALKLNSFITLSSFYRFYIQSQADFFKPYGGHNVDAEYYTSDYDLAKVNSHKTGLSFRYAPYSIRKRLTFKEIEMRYSFYNRSDGLQAHIISAFFNYSIEKKQRR